MIVAIVADAQGDGNNKLLEGMQYGVETQVSFSDGKTPLWLNANKYGLSSLEESNGYFRVMAERPLDVDSLRSWGLGYGVDFVSAYNYTSTFVLQQAYAECRWLKATLAIGSKQYPMELKNNELSSGSQTFGINARPVPQVRFSLKDYYTLPFTNKWLHVKGHIAYGKMTDDNWQHKFAGNSLSHNNYSDDVLYHSKAGYLKIADGKNKKPLSVELGLEMASLFGGTSYIYEEGNVKVFKNPTNIKAFWNAFIPGGKDANEVTFQNFEGNILGSWLARINYDKEAWRLSVYADKFFEDHSAMFHLDYDGYGTGDEWNSKKDSRFFMYDFKDIMLGAELNLKKCSWIHDIVIEYLYTKYQSGPIYHDHTLSISDHIGGDDDYYNHSIYSGWQHWGMVMGNPLYRSPIYNEEADVYVRNNRFKAVHLGISGNPARNMHYRILGTYQDGLGTYAKPFTKKEHNVSLLTEVEYVIKCNEGGSWNIRGGWGLDSGHILGGNNGFQLTISRKGLVKTRKVRK